MANFVFSLLYTQTQLAAAYLMLNLTLISLSLLRSLSSFHTLASHSVLLAPLRLVIFAPLVCGARCVVAQMKTVLARIAMRLVSDARSNGRCLFQCDHQGGSQIRDYGTDSELLEAYLELMNVQNQLLLAGLECLMRVFFLFPLSLFYTETRENAAQDKNVHASVQFSPTSETESEDQRPAHNNNVHDDDIGMPAQFPLTSETGTEERLAQDKIAHDIIMVPVPGTEEQPTQEKNVHDNNILVPVLFPSTSGTAEQAADDKNAHENNISVPLQFSATSDVPEKPSSDVVPVQLPPTSETGTEEEQIAQDKNAPVQLPPASETMPEERVGQDKDEHDCIIVPVQLHPTLDTGTEELPTTPVELSKEHVAQDQNVPVQLPTTPETGTEEHVAQDKIADDDGISVAVHFPPTSEAAPEDPIPDKNLSTGADLIPLSCSYGKLVHAVHKKREMFVRKLKANNRLRSKVYTLQVVKMAEV